MVIEKNSEQFYVMTIFYKKIMEPLWWINKDKAIISHYGPIDNDFMNSPLNDINLRKIITPLRKIIMFIWKSGLDFNSIQIAKLKMTIWLF